MMRVFFASRRRHTSCALVTGVQTCALPIFTAEVITYRPFLILGKARAPGQYPYVPNMTVLTAVSMAGGFTFRAEKDAVAITRLVDGQMSEFRADPLDFVTPGDVANVHERFF